MESMGMLMSSFAERLKRLRRNKQLTQKKAAETAGIKIRQWQDYEAGKKTPTFDRLLRIADYFGVSIDYLVGREDKNGIVANDITEPVFESISAKKLQDDLTQHVATAIFHMQKIIKIIETYRKENVDEISDS